MDKTSDRDNLPVGNVHRETGFHALAHPLTVDLRIREYREVLVKPYRIIHRVIDETVCVMLIVDGRRDVRSLLHRRLVTS